MRANRLSWHPCRSLEHPAVRTVLGGCITGSRQGEVDALVNRNQLNYWKRLSPRLGFLRVELLDRITINPNQCGGRPCIRGTRFRVEDMLELLAPGASHEELLADYAFLEPA